MRLYIKYIDYYIGDVCKIYFYNNLVLTTNGAGLKAIKKWLQGNIR